MELDKELILKHYSRKDVQEDIIRCSKEKEVVGSYGGQGYGKRPDTLIYPNDIVELVKQGITSFHVSEETWKNPRQIDPKLKKSEVNKLRKGWDLVLDIDCKFLNYSTIAAHLLVEALKYHGVKSIYCKFSGNHGYHIAVPFEAFPKTVNGKETRTLFPEAPRNIASYLTHMIKKHLGKKILEKETIDDISRKTGKSVNELMKDGEFDPFEVLDIDTILIASRHLYRMAYSINEKSGLVSVPINPEKVLEFDKERANIVNVKVGDIKYMDRTVVKEDEAKNLFIQAYDFNTKQRSVYDTDFNKKKKGYDELSVPEEAIPEKYFPPCIKRVFRGLEDGKKRALFVLVNFMRSVGWSYEDIDERLREWNKENPEELREVYLVGQIRYHKQNKKNVLPPNCNNKMYYKDMQICLPDNLCRKIKNPVNYARRKARVGKKDEKKGSRKLSEEEKEQRRKVREERKKFKEEVGGQAVG